MENKNVALKELTQSERFTNMVITEFSSGAGEVTLTNFQKRLAQNYFIVADAALEAAEEKRKKKRTNQDSLPVVWANVDMKALALSVVSAARVGWDPLQANHVSLIPFKNNAKGKYGMTLMPGYRGIELRATKYGLDTPDAVIVELVYSNDKFKPIKKDRNNIYESYDFEIVNAFDRGKIVGGFYYHSYSKCPERNKLVMFTIADIEKRKPRYASAEFWGGEKDVWENGKKVGTEHTDGWYDKMCYKTIYRAAYMDITIDSQKIDDDYMRLRQVENEFKEAEVQQEIDQNANMQTIDITDAVEITESANPDQIQQTIDVTPAGPDF